MELKNKTPAAVELMRRLDAFWGWAYDRCGEFYDEYDRGYEEPENEPFECELSSARMRLIEDGIAVDYSAVHAYDACVSSCGPYDDDEGADELRRQCAERCLEEAEANARRVLDAYREVVDRWARKRGVSYTEELRRDELNFTLAVRIAP